MNKFFDKRSPQMKGLYDWVKARVGSSIEVIFEDPNAPRPQPPYISLRALTGSVKIGGRDDARYEDGVMKTQGQRRFTLQVKAFGELSHDRLADIRDSVDQDSVIQQLEAVGLAIQDEGDVADISLEIETGIEERASVDFQVGFTSSVEEEVDEIEDVELENLINGESQVIQS